MATGGSDSNIDPRITENNIRFMENMLRATGKFHIVPKYQMEEEEKEDLEEVVEEEDYSFKWPTRANRGNKHTRWWFSKYSAQIIFNRTPILQSSNPSHPKT